MVLGLLTIAAIPTTVGVCEALSAQKKQNAAQKEKARFHAIAELPVGSGPPVECSVVLAGGELFLDHPEAPATGHKFAGYYFTYPTEEGLLGLVSTIADDPPMLNWIFVDRDTGMLRHAGRKDTVGHHVGPWGWSDDERCLTLQGSAAGFVAAQSAETRKWHIYQDRGQQVADERLADRRQRQVPIVLRRQMELGMESRYVREGAQ